MTNIDELLVSLHIASLVAGEKTPLGRLLHSASCVIKAQRAALAKSLSAEDINA